MSLDLETIFAGKRAFHTNLAERPIAEKLRMLDALRERELAIRGRTAPSASFVFREDPALFRPKPQ
ncbi:MAG: hypothetical protein SFU53_13700 [Terrimicrobiaceae bacterium]|nr:hypothetical protein [Terrimicrobiaceae bacterium]